MNLKKLCLAICMLIAFSTPVWAIPSLQLYIEGAAYDAASETWVADSPQPFKLWVIGDLEKGELLDVKLAAAVAAAESGTITLTPATTSLVHDPSTPAVPMVTLNNPSPDGAIPRYKNGTKQLPPHDIYGSGTKFYEWSLGDFTLKDSPIGDFAGAFPSSFPDIGQINVYELAFSGFFQIHFDAYDSKFAPFSHDALALDLSRPSPVPLPGTLTFLGSGLLALAVWRRKLARPEAKPVMGRGR